MMSDSAKPNLWKLLVVFLLIVCMALSAVVVRMCRNDELQDGRDPQNVANVERVQTSIGGDYAFFMLILGDSQMAGAGWEGGYENCILEAYPNAVVVNLAQGGSCLSNGDIHAQWEFYLSNTSVMPDLILLDGGINDLPHLRRAEFKETGATLVGEALCSLLELIHTASPDTRILYTLMPPLCGMEGFRRRPSGL